MPPITKKRAAKATPPVPHPPIAISLDEWKRRTQSTTYIKRIKWMATRANTYRLLVHGSAHLSRVQKNALHYFADTTSSFEERRSRRLDTDVGNGEGTTSYTDVRGFADAPVTKTV